MVCSIAIVHVFVRLIPKYFMFFGAIVNGTFLRYFDFQLFTGSIYKNNGILYMTLYVETLLNKLTGFSNFLVNPLGFTDNHVIY